MAVGLLLVTHGRIGEALLATAERILDGRPLEVACIGVDPETDPARVEQLIDEAIEAHRGDGLLILTDLFGATPSNLAHRTAAGVRSAVVAGVNLSMLLKLFNYPDLGLEQLAALAVEGGRQGVVRLTEEGLWE